MIIMTVELFFTAGKAARNLSQGSITDTGIYPKRSTNVNAWYRVVPPSGDPSTTQYPVVFPATAPPLNWTYKTTLPARIGLAHTTACPIFRAQDDGSVDPVIIG